MVVIMMMNLILMIKYGEKHVAMTFHLDGLYDAGYLKMFVLFNINVFSMF